MSNKVSARMLFLFITSITLVFTSLYVHHIINTPVIPNCQTTLKINISDHRSTLKGFYLLSVIPNENKPDQHTFIMNGNINENGNNYTISRKFLMKHEYLGDHFFLRVDNIFIDPGDQAQGKINIRGVPEMNQLYFLKIKKLTDTSYIFEENFSPLFICTL
ncbi:MULTISPECIES: hypothetical protein [unclassified Providencia]|uniref:hypothetical protein n=1 Tax=unclassified Providencia TaxID=2633465 RepID=UPI00234A4750|nr:MULTISPECIES: hypothetical protein [unclassified Providencia]